MPLKIFATGATGYIGGDALHAIVDAHPEYELACLVRDSNKGGQVASQFARARLVYGNLDNLEILEEEAKKANIVLNYASADHEAAATALIKGLASHQPDQPAYIIHTSGTGILTFADTDRKTYGEDSTKIYDDWEGIEEVTSLPDRASHRNVDKIILSAGAEHAHIRTAIVCPPTIYGQGRGPGNQRGHQLYELSRCTLEKKHGIQVGSGKTYWTNVHVYDLSDCYLKLVEAAVAGVGNAVWGAEGYYFTENGEHQWGHIAKIVASAAKKQGYLETDEVFSLSGGEADQMTPHGSLMWGANSRCKAVRAKKLLGWKPKERSMEDETPDVVTYEAKRLKSSGILQGHAAKAMGE